MLAFSSLTLSIYETHFRLLFSPLTTFYNHSKQILLNISLIGNKHCFLNDSLLPERHILSYFRYCFLSLLSSISCIPNNQSSYFLLPCSTIMFLLFTVLYLSKRDFDGGPQCRTSMQDPGGGPRWRTSIEDLAENPWFVSDTNM